MGSIRWVKNLKYIIEHRDYDLFKKHLSKLVHNRDLNDEEKDREYAYIKAILYNIKFSNFTNNLIALEQEIERIETLEKGIKNDKAGKWE